MLTYIIFSLTNFDSSFFETYLYIEPVVISIKNFFLILLPGSLWPAAVGFPGQ